MTRRPTVGGKHGLPVGGELVLSPMVDVTDAAFRSLAVTWGAEVTCSEMVSAAGLLHGDPAAWRHVEPWPGESPYGIQFMTGDAHEMAQAVRAVAQRLHPDFIDINLGCPAPAILRSCAGGFLLQDPRRAGQIMRAARAAADEAGILHVSAKMRLGMDAQHHTYLEVAQEAEAAGVSWVTLHARTVAQGYSGEADWTHIARLVEEVNVPVVGNGDLRGPEDVVRMREETGCAGFFIARAAMHDPTVFHRMRQALSGQEPDAPPDLPQRLALAQEYLVRARSLGITDAGTLRRQVMRFAAGVAGAKRLRVALHEARTSDDVETVLAQETGALPHGARA